MKELFEPNSRPLDCCRAVPFTNFQSELASPVNNDIGSVHSLVLVVRCSCDVSEIDKFFNG